MILADQIQIFAVRAGAQKNKRNKKIRNLSFKNYFFDPRKSAFLVFKEITQKICLCVFTLIQLYKQ